MALRRLSPPTERSACGVGFVALKGGEPSHQPLLEALHALDCVEHRGACMADGVTGDGSGIMLDIPFDLLGVRPGTIALGSVFLYREEERVIDVIARTFDVFGIRLVDRRAVPIEPRVLGRQARETMPIMVQLVFEWPASCRRSASLDRLLYHARQRTRTRLALAGLAGAAHFVSLSTKTVVYKALCRSEDLSALYPDLRRSSYRTRFALFHRRFSTNTRTGWNRAQPFRLIGHNGEINTIAGNRSWCFSREQALGLPPNELLTRSGASDSGNLNQMIEALKYRSSMPYVEDALAIAIPPADQDNDYYRFWGRAAEPWDGPALIAYCDGEAIGARIDRNGFRPCRWAETDDAFYLASEAGVFDLDEARIIGKGSLRAGTAVKLLLSDANVRFRDPSQSAVNRSGRFLPNLHRLVPADRPRQHDLTHHAELFGLTREERKKILVPMLATGKEPIGSMGNTARLAVLSEQRRSFFDFFFQDFAQVTNPPLDYLRERVVTDLSVVLGRAPNIFIPKELIPPRAAFRLDSPILDPAQLTALLELERATEARVDREDESEVAALTSRRIDTLFPRREGPAGLRHALQRIADEAEDAVKRGNSVLILSDLRATIEHPPVPSLLALRAVVSRLNEEGLRLRASVVVATGEARTTHHIAALVGFGAAAVCPALAFELAEAADERALRDLTVEQRTANLRKALEAGLLKTMSKMGISVVRSYQSTKLFTPVGVGDEIIDRYFPGLTSVVGGVGLEQVAREVLRWTPHADEGEGDHLQHARLLREDPRGREGEAHEMTAARARALHAVLAGEGTWQAYLDLGAPAVPVSIRHLLELTPAADPLPLDTVEPVGAITARFGAGAMSFGAISAESQRDIVLGMRQVGGRSNSGEGGENPYYYTDGITASTKQIGSGRFGVTAEYLVTGQEVEIKIAQGAKPGEGGQLMGIKVGPEIARARRASPGVSLISPPPQHDIYSIEDLKELVYEIKQLAPDMPVVVKLVAGANIGTIAVGVVKAGADVVQISGGDGGTGAAPISSMMHAGLPWELGLAEVQKALVASDLRHLVRLRVDGGLHTGSDIVIAAALGGEEFGFGKLLLVAEGCIMARVCQKNTCPRGIATHDPKFKARYVGAPDGVAATLRLLAEDVRRHLSRAGLSSLDDLIGRPDLLREVPALRRLVRERGLLLSALLTTAAPAEATIRPQGFGVELNPLNQRIVDDVAPLLAGETAALEASYPVRSRDRGVPGRLGGVLGQRVARLRAAAREAGRDASGLTAFDLPPESIRLTFRGSAGQGFGVFLTAGVDVVLWGEANDGVCKAMSGGRVVIRPAEESTLSPHDNAIIGNGALYGATGGTLLVSGRAGDRFGVRNSGAVAVIDGVGMHACEYMTGGTVVITGDVSHNVGGGMTGGTLYLRAAHAPFVNGEYLSGEALDDDALAELTALLEAHVEATGSAASQALLDAPGALRSLFHRYRPVMEPAG